MVFDGNWEWGIYEPTFGLASVDKETFKRTIKPSGYFYGEISKNNALTQHMIQNIIRNKYIFISLKIESSSIKVLKISNDSTKTKHFLTSQ